jgi:glucose-1-phosphate thymidylyltransferase
MKKKFNAMVPVAGFGTRLRPHTYNTPKVLMQVGHNTILGHIIDELLTLGEPKIHLVVGYLGDKIKEYLSREYPNVEIEYIHQEEAKGLGHAIWLSSKNIKGPVFVLLGDTLLSADLTPFVDFNENCLAVKEVDDPRRFGVVELKDGYICNMVEKPEHPKSNLAIVGAYSFKDCQALYKSLDNLVKSGKKTKGEIQFTDAIMDMISSGLKVKPITVSGWHDCGKPETLLATNRYLLEKHFKDDNSSLVGCEIVQPVYISESAKVTGSTIGPNVSIGDNCEVTDCVISDSIIGDTVKLESLTVSNSIVTKK